ncbi:hypothetical protein ES705_26857 [subsurface metagenome]
MVQLKGKAELAKTAEPLAGKSYIVTKTEEVKTAVQGFNGLRVTFDPTEAKEKATLKEEGKTCCTMLWMRETAGIRSKLGSFLDAFTTFLGDEDKALNSDNWINHTIRLISWKEKVREITVIK